MSESELEDLRERFKNGQYNIDIERKTFSMAEYNDMIASRWTWWRGEGSRSGRLLAEGLYVSAPGSNRPWLFVYRLARTKAHDILACTKSVIRLAPSHGGVGTECQLRLADADLQSRVQVDPPATIIAAVWHNQGLSCGCGYQT